MSKDHLKGHPSLADMISTHIGAFRKGLHLCFDQSCDDDDESYWNHELKALVDIENACKVEMKVCETCSGSGVVSVDAIFTDCPDCTPRPAMRSETPIHVWFGLTYSAYLVLPRLALEHMPAEWQRRLVALLEEAEKVFVNCPNDYIVTRQDLGVGQIDPWADYRHGDAAKLIAEAVVRTASKCPTCNGTGEHPRWSTCPDCADEVSF